MSLKPIECTNCGAQYRLPETFQGDKAKCKKCGAMIDVAAQRNAPPPAAAPAPSVKAPSVKSSVAKSPAAAPKATPTVKVNDEAKSSTSARARRSSTASREPREGAGRARRGERAVASEDRPKSKTPLLVGAGIGAVGIGIALYFILAGNGDQPVDARETGQTPAVAQADPVPAVTTPPEPVQAKDAAAESPVSAPPESKDAGNTPAVDKNQPDAAPKTDPGAKITSADQVFRPKDALAALEWPAAITAEQRQEYESLLDDVRNGGRAGIKAKAELATRGHGSLVPIINRLRELNYLDSSDSLHAAELHKVLGTITEGVNSGYKATDAGEEIPLETADWNAKTVKALYRFWENYSDPEKFAAMVKGRKSKNAEK